VALRVDTGGEPTFADLLSRVRETALGAYEHQAMPFDAVVEALGRPRPRAHHPLFTVMLAVQADAPPAVPFGRDGSLSYAGELHTDAAHFDLTVAVEPRDGGTALAVRYATDLFTPATAHRIAGHLLRVLDTATREPDRPIAGLLRPDDTELAQLLAWGRGPEPPADLGVPVHRRVEAQAAARPDHTAVVCGSAQLTYGELDAAANGLARTLVGLGVRTGVPVAVSVPRSTDAVLAMLAVAKAGGVYVPLDDAYPDEVKRVRLHDARPAVVITREPGRLLALCPPDGAPSAVAPAQPPAPDGPVGTAAPGDIAYIVFTSGSTGAPKAVTAHHAGLTNVVAAKIELFDVRPDSRVLQFVSFGFGVSITDVYMTLAAGATLVMRGPEALSGAELAALVDRHRVTNLVLPASVLAAVPAPAAAGTAMASVRAIAVGGEACSSALVDRWAPGRRFVNAYGPSETCVATATARCHAGDGIPPIGRPIPGSRLYILDDGGEPVAAGLPGELYVGGVGVTPGYLNRPDLTRERFLPDRFDAAPGARMYRTGDRARFRADGQIALLGRADDQVNLRGVRIELGEVEAVLSTHPAVREAVATVQLHPVAGQRLVAFVVVADEPVDAAALRMYLAERLPEHFVPAVVAPVPRLPRTPTGKLDRRALPIAEGTDRSTTRAPAGPTEEILAEIWTDALAPDVPFGADDDFFTQGGQSILAASVMAEIRARFEVDLPVRVLFDAPTIAALAHRVEQAILAQLAEELV
jgi:amino acid adenylation domain-containing protein